RDEHVGEARLGAFGDGGVEGGGALAETVDQLVARDPATLDADFSDDGFKRFGHVHSRPDPAQNLILPRSRGAGARIGDRPYSRSVSPSEERRGAQFLDGSRLGRYTEFGFRFVDPSSWKSTAREEA